MDRVPRYQELRHAVEGGNLCVVKDIGCPRNIAAWVGGSILAILEVSHRRWLTLENVGQVR